MGNNPLVTPLPGKTNVKGQSVKSLNRYFFLKFDAIILKLPKLNETCSKGGLYVHAKLIKGQIAKEEPVTY